MCRLVTFLNNGTATEPSFLKVEAGDPDPTDGLTFNEWACLRAVG